MAPEETMTTLCPSLRSWTVVLTIRERISRSGSWVFSSTIELVPRRKDERLEALLFLSRLTQFDDDNERFLPHFYRMVLKRALILLVLFLDIKCLVCN